MIKIKVEVDGIESRNIKEIKLIKNVFFKKN